MVSVTLFPGRRPKKDKPLRATTMVLACHERHVYLERRPESGIWGGLWCFPEVTNLSEAEAFCADRLAAGLTPACAKTCPTGAIAFGDFKQKNWTMTRLSADRRGYRVLDYSVNTRPGSSSCQ